MKPALISLGLIILTISCDTTDQNPFWNNGVEIFDVTRIYENERFPNVVVATDGTIITTWGASKYVARRSADGGNIARFNLTWLTSGRDWKEFVENGKTVNGKR